MKETKDGTTIEIFIPDVNLIRLNALVEKFVETAKEKRLYYRNQRVSSTICRQIKGSRKMSESAKKKAF